MNPVNIQPRVTNNNQLNELYNFYGTAKVLEMGELKPVLHKDKY